MGDQIDQGVVLTPYLDAVAASLKIRLSGKLREFA